MREIVLFRQNLFRVSEVFITQQAQALRRHVPLYTGRLRYGAGPSGARALLLRDLWRHMAWPRIAAQMLTRDSAPYLRLLAGHAPALVHAHFGVDGVYALPLARRLGVPLVTTFHGFDVTLSTARYLASPAWMNYPLHRRALARQGQLFLCNSGFLRDRALALGFPADRTRVHYIGVDCTLVRPRDPGEETPTILHVARLVEFKGTEYLLRAFARLAPRHGTARLVIIGDGPLRSRLEALARALDIGTRVSFLGAQPHPVVMDWMRRAAMLVLPSILTASGRVEGLGMVLLEAAATGVPVIGSRVGGIPEGIAEGRSGLITPPRDVDALAAAIGTLLADPALRATMGGQARAFVTRQFDLRRQTEILEGYYDDLVRANRSRQDAAKVAIAGAASSL
ncbi:glycosyltransferase [Gluconacetobacter diazotrophicus]|uniref:Putative glycosyl transferase n=1 Tax=Gluconacetobacter diazotrophicus (strain ATCC 49037 / DSM 5601 / CCUG 37298 / CIP 103539 / LMG 7603 / PAl5) TaxID=272568 RepID=A9H6C6_GLUDA|nr:glycosyltransferase [Gluconacetobacter diazotrophicus]CAP54443.1 putative glycosyl transferase [Gluconacetobacter diazotrophicus PA1 5]